MHVARLLSGQDRRFCEKTLETKPQLIQISAGMSRVFRGKVLPCPLQARLRAGARSLAHCVREIFRSVLERGMTVREIARDLNPRNIRRWKARWTQEIVWSILTNPVYTGVSVWGRSSQRLGTRRFATSKDQWAMKPSAFPAIVQFADFDKAQQSYVSHALFDETSTFELVQTVTTERA